MRIAICTDAWHPQVNGVVRSLAMTVHQLTQRGHAVELITPDQFRTLPLPGYSEIRLALAPRFVGGAARTASQDSARPPAGASTTAMRCSMAFCSSTSNWIMLRSRFSPPPSLFSTT